MPCKGGPAFLISQKNENIANASESEYIQNHDERSFCCDTLFLDINNIEGILACQ